jgi:hypothetical protein
MRGRTNDAEDVMEAFRGDDIHGTGFTTTPADGSLGDGVTFGVSEYIRNYTVAKTD